MTTPAVLDYFALEAADGLLPVERWAAAPSASGPADVARAAQGARALRGAATVARQPEFIPVAAAIERALAAAAAPARAPGVHDAVLAAVDAVRTALRAPRPLPPADVERLRAAAAALDAAGPDTAAPAGPGDAPAGADDRVVPIRALARDGDADFVLHRAPNPPVTADQRFRTASIPLAHALRRLIAEARAATPGHAADAPAELAGTLGADVRAALADLRELAESYDVRPVATFFGGREAAAGRLEPRALAAVDAAAAGLVGGQPTTPGAARATPPAPAPAPAPPPTAGAAPSAPPVPVDRDDAFRPATGAALVALLETGISGFGHLDTLDAVAPAPPPNDAAPAAPAADDGVVPVEQLLYTGRAALDRAREVRDLLRAHPGPPDPALLAELYDLLDLAARG